MRPPFFMGGERAVRRRTARDTVPRRIEKYYGVHTEYGALHFQASCLMRKSEKPAIGKLHSRTAADDSD